VATVDERALPSSSGTLARHLRTLRNARYARQHRQRGSLKRRRALRPRERVEILAATAGRCHVCGGKVDEGWEADHSMLLTGSRILQGQQH
jgi:hypothetical protein